ncbi:MAG: hypothetical protein ACOY3L_19160 [Pseudomonadota bacterium]
MRLILAEYLRMLRESGEFDALLPDLLLAMNIVPISKVQVGVRQAGVDLAAVGPNKDGQKILWLFVLKRGDLGRRDWDSTKQSVRQSLDEIKDVYLRNNVAPEHAGLPVKIVVATTGDFKQDFEQQRVGYAGASTQPGREYEFWNGDQIATLMEKYLLDEYALPPSARSRLRRALALISEPDYELDHFHALLQTLLEWDPDKATKVEKTESDHLRALRTISLALGILCRWAAQDGNLKSAVIACERTLLWSWDAICRRGLSENRSIIHAYRRIIDIYLNTTVEYFNKVQAHLHTEDALARYCREWALLAEQIFEEIGLVATIGLSHFLWGTATRDEERVQGARTVASTLSAFLTTHRASGSPCYDGQSIDVALALTLLMVAEQIEPAKAWLRELSSRLTFGFRSGRWFPISTDSFDDLVELEIDRDDVDMEKLKETSWMVPILAQWMAVLDVEDAYRNLADLRRDGLKGTFLQLWYPDEKTDSYLYRGPAHFESGIAEAPIDLPPTGEEMRSAMKRTRVESPVKDPIVSSAANAGIGWLDFIACRHFRTPPDPAVWQALANVSTPDSAPT